MSDNGQDQDTYSAFFSPPPGCGNFVGRAREMAELMAFLSDLASRKSIMLIHGSRGVGKSTLVREAIERAKEQDLPFKNYVWLDRSWVSELRTLRDKRNVNPNAQSTTLNPGVLMGSDSYDYSSMLATKKDQGDSHYTKAIRFLDRALATYHFQR